MKSSSLRKSQQSLTTRESPQFSQQLSELLRSVVSRSDDTTQLLSIMDKPTKRLKCLSVLAEKLVSDAELREDWRISREDSILISLNAITISTASQRSMLEQTTRKILTLILKFAPEPTAHDLNCSEMHVDNVMSNKVSPQSTIIEIDPRSGKRTITVLNGSPDVESWKKHMWKEAKIIEACLHGENISATLALTTCLRFSRKTFAEEVGNVRECHESSDLRQAQISTPQPQMSRKAQSISLALQTKQTSVTHRSVIRTPASCCDWRAKMLEMMMDMNRDSVRAVTGFLAAYHARQTTLTPIISPVSPRSPMSPRSPRSPKAERAKQYETFGPVSPYGRPTSPRDSSLIPDIPLTVLSTIKSSFFPDSDSLSRRVHAVHSAILIQRTLRGRKDRKTHQSATRIQAWFRMVKARKELIALKIQSFRVMYAKGRIRHWLRLLAGRWRMNKERWPLLPDYSRLVSHIVTVQKLVRGFLVRKIELPKVRGRAAIRCKRLAAIQTAMKAAVWSRTRQMEDDILKNALAVGEQLAYFQQTVSQGKKVKGFKRDKDLTMYVRSIQKAEARDRKMQVWKVAETRVGMLTS